MAHVPSHVEYHHIQTDQSVGCSYKVDICRYLVFVGSLTDAFWHLWTRFAINQAKSTEYAIKSTDWEHVVLSLWKCCWPSCQDGLSRDWTTFMRQNNWTFWNAQIPCPCEYLALLDLLARAGFGWYTRWCIFFTLNYCVQKLSSFHSVVCILFAKKAV